MATGAQGARRVPLGEIESARSRHMWTRSSVRVDGALAVAGCWDGTIAAFDAPSLEPRWEREHPESAVGIATLEETVVVAGRGPRGVVGAYDRGTGERLWTYETATDVGAPTRDSVFYRPYVVDLAVDCRSATIYAAARRYERDGDERAWHATIYAIERDGTLRWKYAADASPISIAVGEAGDRLAVGFNRCSGDHDDGLVVLSTADGRPAWTWDPGIDVERRVGDVSFDGDAIAVSSHADKRGYLLESDGTEQWRVDLAVETTIGDETLYAYPNHAHANGGRVAFVTGNTYALEGRETEGRHPNEHRIAAFDERGEPLWDADVGGFVHGLATDGETVVAPSAQNFRVRDPDTHGVRRFDLADGPLGRVDLEGIATAAAVDGGRIAAIEEPVTYHDEGDARGEYALYAGSIDG